MRRATPRIAHSLDPLERIYARINVTKQVDYLAAQVAIATPVIYSPMTRMDIAWVQVVFKKRADLH